MKFLVKATARTPLRLGQRRRFLNPAQGTEIYVSDLTSTGEGSAPHVGLLFDVILDARDADEALIWGPRHADGIAAVLGFANNVAIAYPEARVAYDYEDGLRNRLMVADIAVGDRMLSVRAVNEKALSTVWDARQGADETADLDRAIAWYRKALLITTSIDKFSAFWISLEALNPVLKVKHNLPQERVERACPKCKTPVVSMPSNEGTKFAFLRVADQTTWRIASATRTGLLHGHSATPDVLAGIERCLPALMEAARTAILDLLKVRPEEWATLRRAPMNPARPAGVQARVTLANVPIEKIPIGEPYPHVLLTNITSTGKITGSKSSETLNARAVVVNFDGAWEPDIELRMQTFTDPDGPDATLAVNVNGVARKEGDTSAK